MTQRRNQNSIVALCGKGGVGKTSLSLAMGLLHASQGRRAVVVTSHPLPELAVSISLDGLKERNASAAANLFVLHIEPREILDKLFQGQMPSELLARTVLSSKIYKSLIEIAPGLKEMAFMSRLKELAQRRSQPHEGGSLAFDVLIWDTPATGHFLDTLRVARRFDQYLSGPFAQAGREVTEFFSHAENLAVFPVSTLEEMAVQETEELCSKLKAELGIKPAGILCNKVSPLLDSPGGLAELQAAASAQPETVLDFIAQRLQIEREQFESLEAFAPAFLHRIPRVRNWQTDVDLLFELSESMRPVTEIVAA